MTPPAPPAPDVRVPRVLACVDVARSRRAGRDPLALARLLTDAGATVWWRDTCADPAPRLRDALAQCVAGALVVGGDPAEALAAGAAQLHVPSRALGGWRGDASVALVGASVHDAVELAEAVWAGVDYVTASPVYATASKPGHPAPLGLDGLRTIVAASEVPVLALGGVTLPHVPSLRAAGAAGVAAIGPFLGDDPVAAWRALDEAMQA